eukprot:gnl/TRDRNA2_/TRDRNA2_89410_c0_seq7.p1 gnl/TRDRNA2_/TRDRNA2_89410_c0~~gnl/TRDRNA2_/TRDRNA2_89410_c0_seq7.p1  ORF type:complete len:620 (-),score=86.89 gnl/TRDRNA2_/TRDRNA2_89410_c0_seq7:607-2466(-)
MPKMPACKRFTNSCRQKQASSDYKQINKQIIASSQASTVEPLLIVISQHVQQMNIVNLSTAAHRLAKLASSNDSMDVNTLCHHPVVSQLFIAILDKVDGVEAGSIQPQAISNVTWSLAHLRFTKNPTLVHVLASLMAQTVHAFKPFELTTTIWAFAKLVSTTEGNGGARKLAWSPKYLFGVVSEHISQNTGNYGFRCLATFAWSFASVHHCKESLFRSIAHQMKDVVGEANSQGVGNAVWAFATAGVHDHQLFSMLAEHALPRLHEFKAQEISNMLWGFAMNNFWHLELFVSAVQVATKTMTLFPQHLANIIWAFARVQPRHRATYSTVLALLPLCTQQIHNFKPLEVSSTAFAVAKVFGYYDTRAHSQEILDFFAAAVPLTVLHIEVLSDASLVNFIAALAMLQLSEPRSLEMIEAEAMRRTRYNGCTLNASLLKSFAKLPGSCSSSVSTLASRFLADFDSLNAHTVSNLSNTIVDLFDVPAKAIDLASGELREYLRALASFPGPAGHMNEGNCSCCPLVRDNVEALPHLVDDDGSTCDNVRSEETASLQDSPDEGIQDKEFCGTYRVYVKNSFLHLEDDASDDEEISMSGCFSKYSRSCAERRASSLPPMRSASICY